jgi:outer membrane cobalamin receptor
MVQRRVVLRAVATAPLFVLIGLAACASGGGAASSGRLEQSEGQTITEEQIAKSGARTVWDALRLTVHNITFNETGRGQPTRITRRGRSSMLLDDGPRILVDGVALTDYTVLARMPATDLLSIDVLSAMDATMLYGSNYSGGAIRIHTKTGS